eukprot:9512755-Alexandrium_andersonii.AAC.1
MCAAGRRGVRGHPCPGGSPRAALRPGHERAGPRARAGPRGKGSPAHRCPEGSPARVRPRGCVRGATPGRG